MGYISYLCFTNKLKQYNMRTLFVSTETFTDMLVGFIQSGVTFESEEKNGGILITFTGGY
jgi:hypothetical protein